MLSMLWIILIAFPECPLKRDFEKLYLKSRKGICICFSILLAEAWFFFTRAEVYVLSCSWLGLL